MKDLEFLQEVTRALPHSLNTELALPKGSGESTVNKLEIEPIATQLIDSVASWIVDAFRDGRDIRNTQLIHSIESAFSQTTGNPYVPAPRLAERLLVCVVECGDAISLNSFELANCFSEHFAGHWERVVCENSMCIPKFEFENRRMGWWFQFTTEELDDDYIWGRIEKGLDEGWDVNYRDEDSGSLLKWAVWYSRTKIAIRLLARGATLTREDCWDDFEKTPFHKLAESGNVAIIEALFDHGQSSLSESCDEMGRTPMAVASENGHVHVIELLVAHGCKVNNNCPMRDGDTPLIRAILTGHVNCVEYLLMNGADSGTRGSCGETAVSTAQNRQDDVGRHILKLIQ